MTMYPFLISATSQSTDHSFKPMPSPRVTRSWRPPAKIPSPTSAAASAQSAAYPSAIGRHALRTFVVCNEILWTLSIVTPCIMIWISSVVNSKMLRIVVFSPGDRHHHHHSPQEFSLSPRERQQENSQRRPSFEYLRQQVSCQRLFEESHNFKQPSSNLNI